jgi:hypothetical protein
MHRARFAGAWLRVGLLVGLVGAGLAVGKSETMKAAGQ